MEIYRKAIDYWTFNQLKKNILDRDDKFKINYHDAIFEEVGSRIEKLEKNSLNEDVYNRLFNFHTWCKKIITDIVELHIQIERFYNPIQIGNVTEKDYSNNAWNKFVKLSIEIPEDIERLKYIPLFIKKLESENRLEEAFNIKNLCSNSLGYYLLLIERLGVKIERSPIYPSFKRLTEDINDSINLEELKFISDIKKISNSTLFNHARENDEEIDDIPLTLVRTVGVLIRSGIIDYLKEKNKMSNNQIAGFISLITQEHLKQKSVNPHLSKNNSKYAIQNTQDKQDIDLILKRYNINPQSE